MIRFALGIFCLITSVAILEDPMSQHYIYAAADWTPIYDWLYFAWFAFLGLLLISWALWDLDKNRS